jgi:hypothetical protein
VVLELELEMEIERESKLEMGLHWVSEYSQSIERELIKTIVTITAKPLMNITPSVIA